MIKSRDLADNLAAINRLVKRNYVIITVDDDKREINDLLDEIRTSLTFRYHKPAFEDGEEVLLKASVIASRHEEGIGGYLYTLGIHTCTGNTTLCAIYESDLMRCNE